MEICQDDDYRQEDKNDKQVDGRQVERSRGAGAAAADFFAAPRVDDAFPAVFFLTPVFFVEVPFPFFSAIVERNPDKNLLAISRPWRPYSY